MLQFLASVGHCASNKFKNQVGCLPFRNLPSSFIRIGAQKEENAESS
jgi:hypothetical protein